MSISNKIKGYLNSMNSSSKQARLGTVVQGIQNSLNSKSIIHSSIVTTAGGAAAEDVTISGVLATDQCFVQLSDDGTNNVSVVSAVCAEDKVTITFSGDPADDAIVNLLVIR